MDVWYEDTKQLEAKERRVVFFSITTCLILFTIFAGAILTLGFFITFNQVKQNNPIETSSQKEYFYDSISKESLMNHLVALEEIAGQYSNSRSVNNGYNASVAYVRSQLAENTNYTISEQFFTVTEMVYTTATFQQVTPISQTYTLDKEFTVIEYSPSATVTNKIITEVTQSGCTTNDFAGFAIGNIALLSVDQDTSCELDTIVLNAQISGAQAVLIRNGIRESEPFKGELSQGMGIAIPVLGITYLLGDDLISSLSISVSLTVIGEEQVSYTSNLIAETVSGDPNSIIIVGSHLDSVPAGPGINDNGSGSAVNLEVAIQVFSQNLPLNSKIRFAWWGAEELGLLGSEYYTQNLEESEREAIVVNLNYDMLSSPNFFRGVYNGTEAEEVINYSCRKVMQTYEQFWKTQNLPYSLASFNGRSDFASFLAVNITAGGLKTGSSSIKSAADRSIYGGYANTPNDPCYHKACDTVENVNQEILLENGRAAANILQVFSAQEDLRSFLFGQ